MMVSPSGTDFQLLPMISAISMNKLAAMGQFQSSRSDTSIVHCQLSIIHYKILMIPILMALIVICRKIGAQTVLDFS